MSTPPPPLCDDCLFLIAVFVGIAWPRTGVTAMFTGQPQQLAQCPGFISPWLVCFLPIVVLSRADVASHSVAYFNASLGSHVNISSVLNFQKLFAFSFRTCTPGQLISQVGPDGEFYEISLTLNGSLEVSWKSGSLVNESIILNNLNLIDNEWYTVGSNFHLGEIYLRIEQGAIVRTSVLLANSTFRSYLWYLNFTDGSPLYVGSGKFSGCIQEGPQVLLSSPSVSAFGVEWGRCPLEDTTGCGSPVENPCWAYPCQNDGTCIYSGDGSNFNCQCSRSFTGPKCEIDLSSQGCGWNPCQNNATCQSTNSTTSRNYLCFCPAGFTGVDCEINMNECVSSPCRNGGQCSDGINSFTCNCLSTGYTGILCQSNINECLMSPSLCLNGATCMDTPGSFQCICPTGFMGNKCQNQSNDCLSSPCQNFGTCQSSVGHYKCHCVPGFTGTNCEVNVNDCVQVTCSGNHTVCVDGINSFTCQCQPGYFDPADSHSSGGNVTTCEDINECLSSPCTNGSTCVNRENSYMCLCEPGYTGIRCDFDINECQSNPCQNDGRCENLIGGYRCTCAHGYADGNCSTEINECFPRPCQNGSTCRDLVGRFECLCAGGWTGNLCEVDIDECISQPCLNGAACSNFVNSYNCTCAAGFTGQKCDVNIDDCDEFSCQNNGTCIDGINRYSCSCTDSWMGLNCSLVYDACALHVCQNNATCDSLPPSHNYTCHCPSGFTGLNCELNIDDCQNNSCQAYETCLDGINSYSCSCPVGMTGLRCDVDIDECLSNPCLNGATCVDGRGIYTCLCNYEDVNLTLYTGDPKSIFRIGYSGINCGHLINPCAYNYSSICLNKGICQASVDSTSKFGFSCYCPNTPGRYFAGSYCHLNKTSCDLAEVPDPPFCQYGGTCHSVGDYYYCSCVPGYTGRRCQQQIDECESNPCQYNGTCQDFVNYYVCQCPLGTTGSSCETNIDDCVSRPCRNGGQCLDLINAYTCNCSETGYQGKSCDIDIDECLSQPCLHGATCYNGVKMYNCSCYAGYNGTNCELDIDECLSSPCLHNGTCHQRSDPNIPDFSFTTAAGFDCTCPAGITGRFCETDINECASMPCIYGVCQDLVNGYICNCKPGYRGVKCESEIDECLEYTPCQNNATCRDKVAGYECICAVEDQLQQHRKVFGGKNCSVELVGCQGHSCQNGATCWPVLENEAASIHSYVCQCLSGFTGRVCNVSTVASFDFNSRLSYRLPEENLNDNLSDTLNVSFEFRTTLSNVILLQLDSNGSQYDFILELRASPIQRLILSCHSSHLLTLMVDAPSGKALNDGNWHKVQLIFSWSSMSLHLSDPGYSAESNCTSLFCLSRSWLTSGVLYFGGNKSDILTAESSKIFVGCMQDIRVNNETYVHEGLNLSLKFASSGVGVGCQRQEQCSPTSCNGQGQCDDLWIRYQCHCRRPFWGANCTQRYTAATFGHDGLRSFAQFNISSQLQTRLQSAISVSFFFRTRRPDGLLFYAGSSVAGSWASVEDQFNATFVALQLKNSETWAHVKLTDVASSFQIVSEDITDGQQHFVHFLRNDSLLRVAVDSRTSEFIINSSHPLSVSDFLVGGFPVAQTRNRRDTQMHTPQLFSDSVENFHGTIEDLQLFDNPMLFFPTNDSDSVRTEITQPALAYVLRGEVTSDNCLLQQPCENNSTCVNVFFDDFVCTCDYHFQGRNCSQPNHCISNTCPSGGICSSLADGFECISNATFNGVSSMLRYSTSLSHLNISEISTYFKTRKQNGTILRVQPRSQSLFCSVSLELLNSEVIFHLNTTSYNHLLKGVAGNVSATDGTEHSIRVTFAKQQVLMSVDGFVSKLNYTGRDTTLSDCNFSLNNVEVFVGGRERRNLTISQSELPSTGETGYFKGCLTEVRINSLLLPFFNKSQLLNDTSPARFDLEEADDILIGCVGDDVCGRNSRCKNGATCEDLWNAFHCSCLSGFRGVFCSENIDDCLNNTCENNATCLDGIANYSCACIQGFTGFWCQTDIDECLSSPCLHGGTCTNDINRYSCSCQPDYVGLQCELPAHDDCDQFHCQNNGTCVSVPEGPSPITKKCLCPEKFTGRNCETKLDLCANNTCSPDTSSCQALYKTLNYTCICLSGYTGKNCLEDVDECTLQQPCLNGGNCSNMPGSYVCNCPSEWRGHRCEEQDGASELLLRDDLIPLIIGACIGSSVLILLIAVIVFLVIARKKRATHGTYSPSRQEVVGSRVDMRSALKLPPEERLI